MNYTQLNILEAISEMDKGISVAINHAENVNHGWSDLAFEELKKFIAMYPNEFMVEDFISYLTIIDFPFPPSNRAFGGVIRRAATEGLVRNAGFSKTKKEKKEEISY